MLKQSMVSDFRGKEGLKNESANRFLNLILNGYIEYLCRTDIAKMALSYSSTNRCFISYM